MNEFDHFAKRERKIKHYIRYADDFVILYEDKLFLEGLISEISEFFEVKLKLSLNPDKVFIKTFASGIDFLGWVNFSVHRILRKSAKRRMLKKIKESSSAETVDSYLGLLSHGNTFGLQKKLLNDSRPWIKN